MLKIGLYSTKDGHEANVSLQEGGKFVGHVRYIGFIAWDQSGIRKNKNPDDGDSLDLELGSFREKSEC
jgi:hypothetical protein